MAITTACYCTRDDVKRGIDIKITADENWRVDRAIQSAARNIDKHMHRKFFPEIKTVYYDWPNFQRAYPWRIWFDEAELADVTVNVPVVTTGSIVIPAANIFWGPWNYSPPYTFMELSRASNSSFGNSATPQRDVSITGTTGYSIDSDPAGTATAALSDTTGTTVAVSNGAQVMPGHILVIDSERMLVQESSMVSTGQTNVSGATTASAADNAITVSSGAALNLDEVIQIDSERMLPTSITGNVVTVIRAWDGTVLATHSAATTIYALRSLTVTRGALGTTAATHNNGASLFTHRPPQLIRDLAIAEAQGRVLQETGGYADPQGSIGIRGLGSALADLWDEAETGYARNHRSRVV